MKNILIFIAVIIPVIITVLFIYGIIRIDSHLVLVEKELVLLNPPKNPISGDPTNYLPHEPNPPKYLNINHSASQTNVIFYIDNNGNTVKYRRVYQGFPTTYWYQWSKHKNFIAQEQQQFYIYSQYTPSKPITITKNISWGDEYYPFFSLNNPKKNFQYYFDIYKFINETYYFRLLFFGLAYMFFTFWVMSFSGSKIINIILGLEFLYSAIMFFI